MTITLWQGNIPVDAKDIVEERLARVMRRALAKGFPVPAAEYGTPFTFDRDEATHIQMVGLTITADGPLRLGDYEFVGVVSTLGDGSPFITYAPGVERPDFVVTHPKACDHCQSNRDRTDTYLVTGPEGVRQVGSTCVKDFLGHDPSVIVAYLTSVESLTFDADLTGWTQSASRFYDPSFVIGIASRITAAAGYVSKQKAEDEDMTSTSELIREFVGGGAALSRELERDYPQSDEAIELYNATVTAIEYGEHTNEWATDIVRLFNSGGVQWRHIGILGSAVILGLRAQEGKATANRGESNFIGEKGQRLEFTDVTITLKRQYEGAYGLSFVIRMSVNESDDLLWFASWSEATAALSEGDIINLVGTVKGHEMDKRTERPTTVLTRCSIKE